MRFATWNVNSIRTRVDRVIAFLQRSDTDVLAMQEIKCRPDQFPIEPFEKAGYHVAIHGLNQWNGVAVASRLPILDIQDHFPTQPAFGEPPVVEARALGVTIDTTDALPPRDGQASSLTIWSLYVPNGRELTHAHRLQIVSDENSRTRTTHTSSSGSPTSPSRGADGYPTPRHASPSWATGTSHPSTKTCGT